MSENENKSEKSIDSHRGYIVRKIECRFCIVLLNHAKMILNDKNIPFCATNEIECLKLKNNRGNDTA